MLLSQSHVFFKALPARSTVTINVAGRFDTSARAAFERAQVGIRRFLCAVDLLGYLLGGEAVVRQGFSSTTTAGNPMCPS